MQQGIIFCHGHKHKPYLPSLPFFLPPDINWTLIDIDPNTNPDLVGDYTQIEQTIQQLGTNRYDYVVDKGCPTLRSGRLFQVAHKILKPGGKFIILPGIRKIFSAYSFRYHHYLNDIISIYDDDDLIDIIIQIGAMPTLDQFINLVPDPNDIISHERILVNKYNQADSELFRHLKTTLAKLATYGGFKTWLIPHISNDSSKLSYTIVFTK